MTQQAFIVDADVHHVPRSQSELDKYLPEAWRKSPRGGPGHGYVNPVGVMRRDAIPPGGGSPGSDPETLVKQLLDEFNISYGILNAPGTIGVSAMPNPHLAAALASAHNDWMIDTWLSYDPRLLGAIVIGNQNAGLAAKEIERLANHPALVQVIMSGASQEAYGRTRYWEIFEAAEHHGLPVAIHPGSEGAGVTAAPTAVGYPASYLEWHTMLPQTFMTHLVSMVCEGVFERFPKLRFVFVEGGFGWLPHLMWRLDKNYKALRSQAPWLKRLPSEYIKDHCFLTSQPVEEPDNPKHLLHILEMIDAKRTLMFSSDYPHWDFDSPMHAFPKLPEDLQRRIFGETARELYNLPDPAEGAPNVNGQQTTSA